MSSLVPPTKGTLYTDSNGVSQISPFAVQRAGPQGPLLLQDFHLIDSLAHFDRERIPERVVHAKGQGAHGEWETTYDTSDLTCAELFGKVGAKAPLTIRFSTVGGESGSSDTARDPRGFAIKIKTTEGIMDWVFNNTPVFFLRDPAKFPLFIHTQKRNPQTNLKDKNAFWDYLSLNPESIHQVMILFSDRGTPKSVRKMHGYSGHTFKWVNAKGEWNYIQIHARSNQGIENHTDASAGKMDGENPDSTTQDLFEAINKGDFPSWTVSVQVMTPEQAKKFRYSVNDLTKVWPQKEFPLREVGKITLNKNPQNYFQEIEQVAFSPSHMLPGQEPSNDPVLQSRLFSYPDTHRHRLGTNYKQIPVNCPFHSSNFQRGGDLVVQGSGGSAPNYPSSIEPMFYKQRPYDVNSLVDPVDPEQRGGAFFFTSEVDEKDFEQPRALWEKVFSDTDKEHFVSNVAGHLGGVTIPEILNRQLNVFERVSPDLAKRIKSAIASQ